jgi:cytoskeletal protein RodZ
LTNETLILKISLISFFSLILLISFSFNNNPNFSENKEFFYPISIISSAYAEDDSKERDGDEDQNDEDQNSITSFSEGSETDQTEPATDEAEPATDEAEPATDPTEPATDEAEPATDPTEPATGATEPATDEAEPATGCY